MKALNLYLQSLSATIIQIIKNPFGYLINSIIISAVIAILTMLFVIGNSCQEWEKTTENFPQITIYLSQNIPQANITPIEEILNRQIPTLIRNYHFISKEQALNELQQDAKLKDFLDDQVYHMLPQVMVVNTATSNLMRLNIITTKISKLQYVEKVELDREYVNKIDNLLKFVTKILNLSKIIFIVVIILIVHNLVRLQMLLKQDEIVISYLIGASPSFIIRPLICYFMLQIVIGVGVSAFVVNFGINFINKLILHFNYLFGPTIKLLAPNLMELLHMMAILIILVICTIFITVNKMFKQETLL